MSGALDGLKVLDATHVLAGPFSTYQLALLGADVLKVEPPADPDCARGRGPDDAANAAGMGLNYQVQGGNKRAIAVDLRRPEGRDILLALVGRADVFVENYATGALDALGIGYDALTAVNPALVHCSITGYGDTGPRAAQGAYDNLIQAGAGVIDQSGGHKPGVSFVDYATGYAAAFAILAAVVQRGRTGEGCHVSCSMFEVAMSLMAPEAAAARLPATPSRPREAGIVAYETADGRLMPGAFKPAQYGKLAVCLAAAGHDVPELADIDDWPDVWRLSDALRLRLAEVFRTRTSADWVARLHAADLPADRVRPLAEAVEDPQLAARDFFRPSPDAPDTLLPGAAFSMTVGGPALDRSPPRVGQHTDEVLAEVGYDPAKTARLRTAGVVA